MTAEPSPHRRLRLVLIGGGTVIWVAAVVITALTRDTILVPTVVLLGSFLDGGDGWDLAWPNTEA